MKDDPIIHLIREARRQISAEFQHDPGQLIAHYMKLEKQSRRQFVRSSEINITEATEEKPEDIENILKVSPVEPSVAH